MADLYDIYHCETKPGHIALQWFGYSGVVVRTSQVTLILDPVSLDPKPYMRADVIAITHEHPDHWDRKTVLALQRQTDAVVATTPLLASRLRLAPGKVQGLTKGDVLAFKGARLHAEAADHAADQPLTFLFQSESGITIYDPDDSYPSPEMRVLAQRFPLDVLLFVGSVAERGVDIARLWKPRVFAFPTYASPLYAETVSRMVTKDLPGVQAHPLNPQEVHFYP